MKRWRDGEMERGRITKREEQGGKREQKKQR